MYLDPKEPTFLGFLIMISLYESLSTATEALSAIVVFVALPTTYVLRLLISDCKRLVHL